MLSFSPIYSPIYDVFILFSPVLIISYTYSFHQFEVTFIVGLEMHC
jgi:hypothetical protein